MLYIIACHYFHVIAADYCLLILLSLDFATYAMMQICRHDGQARSAHAGAMRVASEARKRRAALRYVE